MISVHYRAALVFISTTLAALTSGYAACAEPPAQQAADSRISSKSAIYASEAEHLWNRLHRALWVRTSRDGKEYGQDRLDPYLWRDSTHLLEGESRARAIAVLDEFLKEHGENLFKEPLKKAILQRDLWAVFDWSAESLEEKHTAARRQLQTRLAKAIQRLALSEEEIKALPDNFAAAVAAQAFAAEYSTERPEKAFLPPDLMQKEGPWVEVVIDNASQPTATRHVFDFGARSAFRVFLRLPEGRKATLEYMKNLNDFPRPWLLNGDPKLELLRLNPELPQFPAGTKVALVRQTILISRAKELVPTKLTESVQLRVFRSIAKLGPDADPLRGRIRVRGEPETQDGYEFTLSRPGLFAGRNGGLRPIHRDERDLTTQLLALIDDEFDAPSEEIDRRMRNIVQSCPACHDRPGIFSMQSYTGGNFPRPRFDLPRLSAGDGDEQAWNSNLKKREQYRWGLLSGLWQDTQE
jgi:hypothetical protein